MIHLHLGAEDLGRVRFAFSPLWETVTSLRVLSAATENWLHSPWLQRVRPRLHEVDIEVLGALVRPAGYIPDFLVPSPRRRSSSFASGLAEVAATPVGNVTAQLSHLAEHRLAQLGPGRDARVRLTRELAADPDAALVRIASALDRYWRLAVGPYWSRIHSLLQADLAFRLDELAAGGISQLFRSLHPSVSFDGSTLTITKYYEGHADLGSRGLLLVPCVFAWPDVIVLTAEPSTPTVTYSPRGVGRLWEAHPATGRSPLAEVLGRTRATLLSQLDLPMSTTQLATHLDLSAPTLSVHLKALHAAGIVGSRRDGRSVLYQRTPLGELLLAGGERS